MHTRLGEGTRSGAELTGRCLDRISATNPLVRAVIAVDDTAEEQAAGGDRRYADRAGRGPLDGIPVLIKDNIDTRGLASTAGSRLLAGSPPETDAVVVQRLRAAGAVVLGKTNLSEWSNFRSAEATEGWSAVGGQTRNPYVLAHSPWGSSSGSAVAVATGMAPLAIGTETDGSVVGPAGICGVVGLKPEHGLVPLDGIAPVSTAQDVAGVFATTVADAATCLAVLAGKAFPLPVPVPCTGIRLGLWRVPGMPEASNDVLAAAASVLREAGVTVVDVELNLPLSAVANGIRALFAEFRPAVEAYLATREGVPRTLPALIAANRADPVELSVFGQDLFEQTASVSAAERQLGHQARTKARTQARAVIHHVLAAHRLHAVIAPSNAPAWPIDHRRGDPHQKTSSTPAALAGYPVGSLPMGFAGELPIGMSVFGPATMAGLLPLLYALEGRLPAPHPPRFHETSDPPIPPRRSW
jgi:amidase